MADLLTIEEIRGGLDNQVIAWVGDGNNMANSWIEGAAKFGYRLRLACPEGLEPDAGVLKAARRQRAPRLYCYSRSEGGGGRRRLCGHRLLGLYGR